MWTRDRHRVLESCWGLRGTALHRHARANGGWLASEATGLDYKVASKSLSLASNAVNKLHSVQVPLSLKEAEE